MKVSELIEKLQKTLHGVGDIEVKVAFEQKDAFSVRKIDEYMCTENKLKIKTVWICV